MLEKTAKHKEHKLPQRKNLVFCFSFETLCVKNTFFCAFHEKQ